MNKKTAFFYIYDSPCAGDSGGKLPKNAVFFANFNKNDRANWAAWSKCRKTNRIFVNINKSIFGLLCIKSMPPALRRRASGGNMWESNPPGRLLAPLTGFEDRGAHQHPATPICLCIIAQAIEKSKGKKRIFVKFDQRGWPIGAGPRLFW